LSGLSARQRSTFGWIRRSRLVHDGRLRCPPSGSWTRHVALRILLYRLLRILRPPRAIQPHEPILFSI